MTEKTSTTLWSLAVLIVFLALWQWLPAALGVPEFVLPNLSKTVDEGVRVWSAERLLWHGGITLVDPVNRRNATYLFR